MRHPWDFGFSLIIRKNIWSRLVRIGELWILASLGFTAGFRRESWSFRCYSCYMTFEILHILSLFLHGTNRVQILLGNTNRSAFAHLFHSLIQAFHIFSKSERRAKFSFNRNSSTSMNFSRAVPIATNSVHDMQACQNKHNAFHCRTFDS